jgi:hypothetical protein
MGVDLTTTRQGRRIGLELALLVSALVVAGLSVLGQSGAAMGGCDTHCGTPRSHQWTAAESDGRAGDSSDDDDDNDEGMSALPAVSTSLTADYRHTPLVTRAALDSLLSLGSYGHSLRGPPRLGSLDPSDAPARAAGPFQGHPQNPSDDCDDNDNNERVGALPEHTSRRVTDPRQLSILNHSKFDTSCTSASDGHSLRAPPP